MNFVLILFYIFLLILPTQLGRHFFFHFSQTSGIQSDYLVPTVYLSDIFIFLMIFSFIRGKLNDGKRACMSFAKIITISILGYLLLNSFFIAQNQMAALYKFIKSAEFILFGFLIVDLKPKISRIITILSIDMVFLFVISLWQFLIQHSIGGIFWWLGERTFSLTTPGIARFSLSGELILRPYATFPHPNVLGGFAAVVTSLILYRLLNLKNEIKTAKFFLILSFICGILTLIISFSRASFMVAVLAYLLVYVSKKCRVTAWLKKRSALIPLMFYFLIFLSVAIFFIIPKGNLAKSESWEDRRVLIITSLKMTAKHPLFGMGINNFINSLSFFADNYSEITSFQPVHNIYLLVLSESGLIGISLFLIFLSVLLYRSLFVGGEIFIALTAICFLGLSDHYIYTLEQGQLLFTLFASLAFVAKNKLN